MAKHLENLETLFHKEMMDLYDAEHQLIEALPKMAEAATNPDLKKSFKEHTDMTRRQAERIEKIMKDHGEKVKRETCHGMKGIIEESKELLREKSNGSDVLDAALIASAQKAEHYEIASYGTVRTYAEQLGYKDAAKMLQQTLDEESKTNERLTDLAVKQINKNARS
jgi:ferritin-like metal-binding protein YciE